MFHRYVDHNGQKIDYDRALSWYSNAMISRSIIALVAGIFYLNSAVRSNIRSINALNGR